MSDVDRSLPDHRKRGLSDPGKPRLGISGERQAARSPWAARWWVLPLVTIVVTAGLLGFMTWQVVVRGPIIAWDWPLHIYVDPRQPDGFDRRILNIIASLAGQRLYTLPIVLSVCAWVAWKQRSIRPLLAIGAGGATVLFVGYWIKFDLARTAPHTGIDILQGDGQAFPSGHTANATLTWLLIVIVLFGAQGWRPDPRLFWRWIVVAVAFIFISGMLMTLLDYHWFSDIPGGWLLGGLAVGVACAILRAPIPWPTFRRRRDRPSERDQRDSDGS